MKAYWNFEFEDVFLKTSGELTFDIEPCFIAASTILQPEEMKVADKMLGMGPFNTQVIGVDGKNYSLYNCRITEVQHRMGPSYIIEFKLPFSMIIQENEVDTKYHFWENINDSYYSDAKLVRDKITHNNPEKTVSSRQLRNTEELVKNWSKRLILVLIGLEKVPSSMCLVPANEAD